MSSHSSLVRKSSTRNTSGEAWSCLRPSYVRSMGTWSSRGSRLAAGEDATPAPNPPESDAEATTRTRAPSRAGSTREGRISWVTVAERKRAARDARPAPGTAAGAARAIAECIVRAPAGRGGTDGAARSVRREVRDHA